MVNALLINMFVCHTLCLGFCAFATQVLAKNASMSRFIPNGDENIMLQSNVQLHPKADTPQSAWHNDPQGVAAEFNGVPIYGYDRVNRETGGMGIWIVKFPESHTRNMLFEACSNLAAPAKCVYVGHPEQQGLPFITVASSEAQLRTSVKSTCLAEFKGIGLCGASYIEVDAPMKIAGPHFPVFSPRKPLDGLSEVPWGLDRTNSRKGLDDDYTVDATGEGIHVFVLDTGIVCNLTEFGGRAIPTLDMTMGNAIECEANDYSCAVDRNGHGTHVAGTVASKTYGIAKEATVHSVKVLSDYGGGSWSSFIGAIDWVGTSCKNHYIKRAVVSASLGGMGPTMIVEEAINAVTARGISVVVAAGNENMDACQFLPARVKSAITVAAMEWIDPWDIKATYSNFGNCVDIFAPGTNITSLGLVPDSAMTASGTSMAAPHVSGVVALLFERDPMLNSTNVGKRLQTTATKGCVKNLFPLGLTHNKLLYFGTDKENRSPCKKRQSSP